MESLSFNVKERVPRLRVVIYELLEKVKLSDAMELNMIIDLTLRNINDFSDDGFIYQMCKHIGQNNSQLIIKSICTIL